jgi:hypothetical protein
MRRHYLPPRPIPPLQWPDPRAAHCEPKCTPECTGYTAKRPIGSISCQSLTPTVSSTLKIVVFCDSGKGGCSLRLNLHSLEEDCLEGAKDCSAVDLIYCRLLPAGGRQQTVSRALEIAVHAEPQQFGCTTVSGALICCLRERLCNHPTCRPPDWFSQLGLAEDGLEGARDCSAVGPQSVAFESGFAAVSGSVCRLSRGR